MNMQGHILAALKEQFNRWEELLASLTDEQINAPLLPSEWTIKDIIAHLMAWQKRSIARVEAALSNREPEFPQWIPGVDPNLEGNTDPVNAWIYGTYHVRPWSDVQQEWREGFLHLLESGEWISERNLLDSSRYPWLEGYTLANVFLATYDHHQEHLENLLAWLKEHGGVNSAG